MLLTFNCSNLTLVLHDDEGNLLYGHTASNIETKIDINKVTEALTTLAKEVVATFDIDEKASLEA